MSARGRKPNWSAKPWSLPTERQVRSKTFGWMNCTGFGFRSKVMTEDGRPQQSSSRRTRPSHRLRAAKYSATLSDHSNQDENSDFGQESDADDRDRKEHIARRERVHECLASCEAPGINHS